MMIVLVSEVPKTMHPNASADTNDSTISEFKSAMGWRGSTRWYGPSLPCSERSTCELSWLTHSIPGCRVYLCHCSALETSSRAPTCPSSGI